MCRFGAQASDYFSVAQHALLVQWLVVESGYPELALAALHHDSHEAYLCDIPKPLKRKISAYTDVYDETCKALDCVIAEAFGFELPREGSQEKAIIKRADIQALLMEAARLLPDGGKALRRDRGFESEEFREPALLSEPLAMAEAEKRFLQSHADLMGDAPRRP